MNILKIEFGEFEILQWLIEKAIILFMKYLIIGTNYHVNK